MGKEKGKRQNEKGEARNWLLLICFSFFVFPFSFAAIAQTTQSAPQLAQWLTQLAHDDPAIRDEARINLMGLKRGDLEALRVVVEKHQPLAPAQSAALRDIVAHVYLSGEPRDENSGVGFLGVSLADMYQAAAGEVADPEQAAPRQAVLITATLPGFIANRYLQAGDIVQAVITANVVITTYQEALRNEVQRTRPGDTITLRIVRQGKPMRISFPVDCQPTVAEKERPTVEEFRNQRMLKAEEYWNKTFAPLATKLSSL